MRHPMYMSTLLLFLMMPQVLEEGLAGYKEYKKRVCYKVIPFVW